MFERVASSAESSTISPWFFACFTHSSVMVRTSSFVFFSLTEMCKSEVGMMRCMLLAPAFETALMSVLTPLEALQISAFSPSLAIRLTASNSPSDTAAKPASIMSTPSSSRR